MKPPSPRGFGAQARVIAPGAVLGVQRIATAILIVFFALPASAAAEERIASMVPTARQLALALDTEAILASARLAQAQSVRNDSLKNGALIVDKLFDRRSLPTVRPSVRLAITF